MIAYQQTDSAALYTGASLTGQPANTATVNRLCVGTPGTAVNALSLDAFASSVYALAWDIPIPNFTLWRDGSWIVRLNVRQANPSVTWNRCYLYRLNSAGTKQSLIGQRTDLAVVLTTPGVKSASVSGEAQPTRTYGDRVVVVCCFTNQGTVGPTNLSVSNGLAQAWSFVSDQLFDSPFTGGN